MTEQSTVFHAAIVGGGSESITYMDALLGEKQPGPTVKIVGVADPNRLTDGCKYARKKGIFTTTDYREFFKLRDLDMIIELTGRKELAQEISRTKPDHVLLIDHAAAPLFLNILRTAEQKTARQIKAEEALKESRGNLFRMEFFSQIVQASSIPTFVIDIKHRITHWNVACENLTGIAGYEMLGTRKQWLAFYDKKRPVMADLIVDSASEEEIVKYYGGKCRRSTMIAGAYESEDFFSDLGEGGKWVFFTAAPLRDAKRRVMGAIETLQDISKHKQAEEELKKYHDQLEEIVEKRTARLKEANLSLEKEIKERRRIEKALRTSQNELIESEESYHTIFDSTPNSIFVLERDTFKILGVNGRALEIYGYEERELIGKSFMDLGSDRYTDGVLSPKGQKAEITSSNYPKRRHCKKDGTPFYVNVYAHLSKRSSKFGIVAVTVDITETLAKESQLIQASKMSVLGEMASGIAHELNQPLSTIQIGTDFINSIINQGQGGRDDLPEVTRHMSEQVDRAVKIINHLREFGRKTDIKKEKVIINNPIKGVFTLLNQQLKLHGIKIVLDLEEDLPPILGDEYRLEQVFINLIINARNAMEGKKEEFALNQVESILTIRSFRENGDVVVTVTDTGTGIPDDIKDKIFDPFFTTRGVGKGTGLGLSISYGIIEDYDGMIEVESELGKGTTFKLTFPVCPEE